MGRIIPMDSSVGGGIYVYISMEAREVGAAMQKIEQTPKLSRRFTARRSWSGQTRGPH